MLTINTGYLKLKLKANISKNANIVRCLFLDEIQQINKETDVFIASYPRSGNTWLRLLMSDVILQLNDFDTDTELPIGPDFIIPDIHSNNIKALDSRLKTPYRLLKTHGMHSHIKGKLIYLFRNPSDSLVSYYHFHLRYDKLKSKASDGIDIFCRRRMHWWCCHLNFDIQLKSINTTVNNILFVSYEMLHSQPVDTLNTIMNFYYGCEVDKDLCYKAVNNHLFQKHQSRENLDGFNKPFFRKGKVGDSKKELTEETLSLIEKETIGYYDRAKKLAEIDFNHFNQFFR